MRNTTLMTIGSAAVHFETSLAVGEVGLAVGMLADLDANGAILKHGTASGIAEKRFVLENLSDAGTATGVYTEPALVRNAIVPKGEKVWAWLANNQNATLESYLESAGDGTLQVVADPTASNVGTIVGRPEEAINNTSGGPVRIEIRVYGA